MSINMLVTEALESLEIDVEFQTYSGDKVTYITFFEYNNRPERFSEDKEQQNGNYIQVDYWTSNPVTYSQDVKKIKKSMVDAGFDFKNQRDLYEDETQIHHKALRFFILQNTEETEE
ncbi:hypothetical protein [Priestia aryabhattai]|uniref:hypothetical protein n=1 Tax=Priestia aryabhattai TaxID=412384 RepID=UPI003CB60816